MARIMRGVVAVDITSVEELVGYRAAQFCVKFDADLRFNEKSIAALKKFGKYQKHKDLKSAGKGQEAYDVYASCVNRLPAADYDVIRSIYIETQVAGAEMEWIQVQIDALGPAGERAISEMVGQPASPMESQPNGAP